MLNVDSNSLLLQSSLYGKLQDKEIVAITMKNRDMSVSLTNLGCSITSICTKDKHGILKNIVAGFTDLADYKDNPEYFGSIIGRYANRIAGGRFILNGRQIQLSVNDKDNHLHGGLEGFNKKIWNVDHSIQTADKIGVVFSYLSRDGEEGYPGNLRVMVQYTLNHKGELCIHYEAETDQPTPVNLTNHSYFNLTGFETPLVTGHVLQVNASEYTEKNTHNLPTGLIRPVAGGPLDFTKPVQIASNIARFPLDQGFDHNFVLAGHLPGEPVVAACLKEPSTGRVLTVFTSQPAIQVYTANSWNGTIRGQQGYYYRQHGAVALETQAFPDSPNHPSFPNTILQPGERYKATTIYAFTVE